MINKYTDAELKVLLKNLCVICDTREQKWQHIKQYFDDKKINYKVEKLQQGDYSVCIQSNDETIPIGITRDLYFTDEVVVERKANIDEVAGNMKEPDRTRLKKEFSYLRAKGVKVYFYIQDENYDINIRQGNYRSQYNPKALYASIKDFESEFGFEVRPVRSEVIGSEIYYTLYYHVRSKLMGK